MWYYKCMAESYCTEMYKMNSTVSVHMLQLQNCLTDLDTIWYSDSTPQVVREVNFCLYVPKYTTCFTLSGNKTFVAFLKKEKKIILQKNSMCNFWFLCSMVCL
jgi:hypothetical protein